MTMYIRATGNISPQKTFGHPAFPLSPTSFSGNRLSCAEPDYKNLIDPKMIRRMSRIIQMGVAAAKECLQEAGIDLPDAIITGTAYGCMQDTGLFLTKMVEYHEELLTPTAFIQSTHNTIGAQIALMLQCREYNNAFVHRGFSFESALLDSQMRLLENPGTHVLAGAIDEITDYSHAILSRLGMYKQGEISTLDLLDQDSKGTVGGEGAAFFLFTDQPSAHNYARLDGFTTFYKPSGIAETESHIKNFLSAQSLHVKDIDLVITGRNGDTRQDAIYDSIEQTVFPGATCVGFKNLCGEYPTASAFALWMAATALKNNGLPFTQNKTDTPQPPLRKILIYNHYQDIHHSLLLLSAC